MAIYRSNAAQTDVRPANHPEGVLHREHFTLPITVGTANTDQFYLAHILKDSTLSGFFIDFPALDGSGVTATCSLGDTGTFGVQYLVPNTSQAIRAAGRFVSTANPTLVSLIQGAALGSLPVTYSVPDYLVLYLGGTVNTPVTTGTIKGWVEYKMTPYFHKRRGS